MAASPSFSSQRPDSTWWKAAAQNQEALVRCEITGSRARTHMHAQTHTHTGTVCELSILFGELLPLVELQEAVGPQAMCVRQTLHDGVEKTLIQTQGTKDRFGTLTQNKITNKQHYLFGRDVHPYCVSYVS